MGAGVGKEEMAPGQRSGQWGLGSGGRKQRLGHQAWLGAPFGGKRAGGAAWRWGGAERPGYTQRACVLCKACVGTAGRAQMSTSGGVDSDLPSFHRDQSLKT